MILLDSCVYIDLLRARIDPVARLRSWIEADAVVYCGIIRVEVLRGLRNPRVFQRMSDLFDVTREAPMDSPLSADAASLAWRMDREGHVIPTTDLIIAQCAIRTGATLVSTDRHFAAVPELRVRPDLPTLPPTRA